MPVKPQNHSTMNGLQRIVLAAGFLTGITAAQAQYPYTWVIQGIVTDCYPGQTVTIATAPGTSPSYNFTVDVDSASCTFTVPLGLSSAYGAASLTTMCAGAVITATDSAYFGFLLDTVYTTVTFNCGTPALDCTGVPGGSALPGTPCNDGNPITINDTWSASCVCLGDTVGGCSASFTVSQAGAWNISTTNLSGGVAPIGYSWWMPDGSNSTDFEPDFAFTAPGVYGICLTITDFSGCTSSFCDTVVVDSAGMIYTGPVWFDCLGVLWGSALPGTTCDDGDSTTINDAWTPFCTCVGTGTGTVDCLGIPGGPNLPGTACTDSIGGMIVTGIWDSTCTCVASTVDCLGIPGGPNMPGTPCNDGDPMTINDLWSPACVCVGTSTSPCQADFWVVQAYTYDSLLGTATPIPYELWVWNLSSGGSGTYSFVWDFGDGTSSTDPYPTHNYSGNGPYNLCLTINDGLGCVSTHCDTVAIDSTGILAPFAGGGTDRASGFTLNVRNPEDSTAAVVEVNTLSNLEIWPNPATEEIQISLNSTHELNGMVRIHDMTGRVVWQSQRALVLGGNRTTIPLTGLGSGMYVLRIGEGNDAIGRRFVKR